MPDLEVGIEEVVDTPAVQAPEVAEDSRVHQVISSLIRVSTRPPPPSVPGCPCMISHVERRSLST